MRSLLTLCSLLLLNGCSVLAPGIPGSGVIKQETRQVGEFTRISFAGAADIKVAAGAETPACTIQCDDNLLTYISTEVVDNELRIQLNGTKKIMPTKGLQIEIAVPNLESLKFAGGTTTSVTGLKPAKFDVELAGSNDLECEGQADSVQFKLAGACKISAAKLQTKSTSIDLAGSGSAEVQASETLDVKIAGSGTIRYLGEPAITKSIAGAGKIEKME